MLKATPLAHEVVIIISGAPRRPVVALFPRERGGLSGSSPSCSQWAPLSHLGINCACTDGWLHITNLFHCCFPVNILSASKDRSRGGRVSWEARGERTQGKRVCREPWICTCRFSWVILWSIEKFSLDTISADDHTKLACTQHPGRWAFFISLLKVPRACLPMHCFPNLSVPQSSRTPPRSLWGSFTTSPGIIIRFSFSPSFRLLNAPPLGGLANYRKGFLLLSTLYHAANAIGGDQRNAKCSTEDNNNNSACRPLGGLGLKRTCH